MLISSLTELKGSVVLVLAMGGGGDIVSTMVIAKQLERLGARTVAGGILWERSVVDPNPGPVPFECIKDAELKGLYGYVTCRSYVLRDGKKFKPQLAAASEAVGEGVAVIDVYGGVEELGRLLRGFRKMLEPSLLLG